MHQPSVLGLCHSQRQRFMMFLRLQPAHLEVAYSPSVPGQLLAVVVHQTHVTEDVGPALTNLHSTAQQGVASPISLPPPSPWSGGITVVHYTCNSATPPGLQHLFRYCGAPLYLGDPHG